ncbi:MAG: flavin reductase family protein, partial [Planctomycetota bacterium]|nr:flavin reductase family protein [Planctomycetota bacterium]
GDRRGGAAKDTRSNLEATGEFVVNVVGEKSGWRMVKTSVDHPPEISEFEEVGLEAVPSERVRPPRIAECAVSLECKVDRVLTVGTSTVFIGEVVLFHVRDDVLGEDRTVDPAKLRPLGRLGGSCYTPLRDVVSITPTDVPAPVVSDLADMWRRLRDRRRAIPGSPEVAEVLERLEARDAELETVACVSSENARAQLRQAIEEEAFALGWMSARLGRDL